MVSDFGVCFKRSLIFMTQLPPFSMLFICSFSFSDLVALALSTTCTLSSVVLWVVSELSCPSLISYYLPLNETNVVPLVEVFAPVLVLWGDPKPSVFVSKFSAQFVGGAS